MHSDPDRTTQAAQAFLAQLRQGENPAILVCRTREEKHACIEKIRAYRRQTGTLDRWEKAQTILMPLQQSAESKVDPAFYRQGNRIITFETNAGGFRKGDAFHVEPSARGLSLRSLDDPRRPPQLFPFAYAHAFKVYQSGQRRLAARDWIRLTKTQSHLRYTRGVYPDPSTDLTQLRAGEIHQIDHFTRSHQVRLRDGRTLAANHLHLDYGYAVTPEELPVSGVRGLLLSDQPLQHDPRVLSAARDLPQGMRLIGTPEIVKAPLPVAVLPDLSLYKARAATRQLRRTRGSPSL